MTLPRETVSSPSHHVIPAAIRPEASVYVVVTIDSPTHSDRKSYVLQRRASTPVGFGSPFASGESAIAACTCAALIRASPSPPAWGRSSSTAAGQGTPRRGAKQTLGAVAW